MSPLKRETELFLGFKEFSYHFKRSDRYKRASTLSHLVNWLSVLHIGTTLARFVPNSRDKQRWKEFAARSPRGDEALHVRMTGLKWSGFLAQHESELWSSELRSIRAPIVCLACFPSLLPRLSRKLLWSPIFFGRTTLKMALGRWLPLRCPRKAVAFTNWKLGIKEAREWDKNGRISKRNFRNEKVASETGKGYEALFGEF